MNRPKRGSKNRSTKFSGCSPNTACTFESTIQQLVALATLMPIVANIGGNIGNQTVAVVVRGSAGSTRTSSASHLLREASERSRVDHSSAALAVVMAAAILLNLIIAALVGVFVPLLLERSGWSPAQGSSVMLTFVTDGMGFFLFLGLARMF